MKTLNDFKNENKDLEKLEMINTQGGLADPKVTKEISTAADSNWNCGDIRTCTLIGVVNGANVWKCDEEPLPDGTID